MKKLILVFCLFAGAGSCLANTSMPSNARGVVASEVPGLIENNEMLGQKGVDFLGSIAKTSRLYVYLMSLSSNVPEISRQLEFVALFNEAHATTQELSQIKLELQKMNQLLAYQYKRGQAMNG